MASTDFSHNNLFSDTIRYETCSFKEGRSAAIQLASAAIFYILILSAMAFFDASFFSRFNLSVTLAGLSILVVILLASTFFGKSTLDLEKFFFLQHRNSSSSKKESQIPLNIKLNIAQFTELNSAVSEDY